MQEIPPPPGPGPCGPVGHPGPPGPAGPPPPQFSRKDYVRVRDDWYTGLRLAPAQPREGYVVRQEGYEVTVELRGCLPHLKGPTVTVASYCLDLVDAIDALGDLVRDTPRPSPHPSPPPGPTGPIGSR